MLRSTRVLLFLIAVAAFVCITAAPSSAYYTSYTASDFPPTGTWEYETWLTYFGDIIPLSGYSGTLAAGASFGRDTSPRLPEYVTDFGWIYHPPDPWEPQSFFDVYSFKKDYTLWEYDALDNQLTSVRIPGFGNGYDDLYVAVNLKQYAQNNSEPGFDFMDLYQITNGNVAGLAGIHVSNVPITINPYSTSGFASSSWYTGYAQVNAEFHGAPIPEPSGILALSGGILGLLGFARRRRR
jgi:hypothetical protein